MDDGRNVEHPPWLGINVFNHLVFDDEVPDDIIRHIEFDTILPLSLSGAGLIFIEIPVAFDLHDVPKEFSPCFSMSDERLFFRPFNLQFPKHEILDILFNLFTVLFTAPDRDDKFAGVSNALDTLELRFIRCVIWKIIPYSGLLFKKNSVTVSRVLASSAASSFRLARTTRMSSFLYSVETFFIFGEPVSNFSL